MKKVLVVVLMLLSIVAISQQKFPENLERYNPNLPLIYINQLGGGYWQVSDSSDRNAIPIAKRAIGMAVSYQIGGSWVTKRFEGADTSNVNWINESNWSEIGGGIDTTNIIYSQGGNNVMEQNLVIENDTLKVRKIANLSNGIIISPKDTLKINANIINIGNNNSSTKFSVNGYPNMVFGTNCNINGNSNNNFLAGFGSSISNSNTSFLFGGASNLTGSNNIALGQGCLITGSSSVAISNGSVIINGMFSTGIGRGIYINKNSNIAVGLYNDSTITNEVLGIGVGTSNIDRKNGLSILSTGSILMQNISSATTPTTLYYNTTTKEVSYGTAPVIDTTSIYAALDGKADTSIITRFEQDSIAKNTTIATKWGNSTNNFAYPNSKLINSANADLNIGTNGRTDISIDSLTSGQITIGNGSAIPALYFKYTDGTMNNYISCNTGGTGRLSLTSSTSIDFADNQLTRWRLAGSTFQPTSNGSYNIGTTSLYVGTTYSNAVLADGTAARTWGMGRNTSGAGNGFTFDIGGAASGSSNSNGGDNTIKSGISTGNGYSSIVLKAVAANQGSGTTDRTPQTVATVDGNGINLASGKTFRINGVEVPSSDSISCVLNLNKGGSLVYQNLLLAEGASYTSNMGHYVGKNSKLKLVCATIGVINAASTSDSCLVEIRKVSSNLSSQITNGSGSSVATITIKPTDTGAKYYIVKNETKDVSISAGDILFAEIIGLSGTSSFTDIQLQLLLTFKK